MLTGCLVMLLWIFAIAFCIVGGLMICSPILFLIGVLLMVIPLMIGDFHNSNTPRGHTQKRREYNRQKKIEKEFGIIEYWEDK